MSPQSRNNHHIVFITLAVLLIFDALVWRLIFVAHASSHPLELYYLDVGQGDSELIRLPNGANILIDAGPPNGKVLERLNEVLPPGDSYIDLLMMTHPQLDHFGGFIDVLKKYNVGMFLGSGRKGEIGAY